MREVRDEPTIVKNIEWSRSTITPADVSEMTERKTWREISKISEIMVRSLLIHCVHVLYAK